ncbi:GHKL domain-containing protein [Cellulosilyticum ruminicola]|uniref:GHKL domain-containing protein n=1 Tax=Cellulosilyticum ruminicola TaxID=425254 RepID=UPI0006CFDCED|nr:GHKL domain-containing protein [Cellulosilyticum ruminicola]
MIVKQYEVKEKELVHNFSNQQLEAYKCLIRLERENEVEKNTVSNEVTKLIGLIEPEQIECMQPYVEALQEQLIIEENNILTGNTIVDAIMNEKYKVACEKHILISINISLPEKLGISVEELCLIIGNSIDYALEACENITLGKGRKVKIKGVWYKGYIIFKIWFSKSENAEQEKISSATETRFALENDLYGLGAVNKIIQRYDGKLEFYTEGKWHKLEICFNTVSK